jgi:hypothetical protein
MYRTRRFTCEDCGEQTERKRNDGHALICELCGRRRAAEAQRQLSAGEGPAHDAWVAGMLRHAQRVAASAETRGPGGQAAMDPPARQPYRYTRSKRGRHPGSNAGPGQLGYNGRRPTVAAST